MMLFAFCCGKKVSATDELSRVFNRRKIIDLLTESCRNQKHDRFYTVMLDIDSFKSINDTYEHLVGDRVIRHLADHLTGVVDTRGVVGRYGGDAFLPIPVYYSERKLTISAGMIPHSTGQTCDMLVSLADDLLLKAKRSGKNQVQLSEI